jgi:hypothetical protein
MAPPAANCCVDSASRGFGYVPPLQRPPRPVTKPTTTRKERSSSYLQLYQGGHSVTSMKKRDEEKHAVVSISRDEASILRSSLVATFSPESLPKTSYDACNGWRDDLLASVPKIPSVAERS